MEPDHMQLIAGEHLTVQELLDGLFLVSANDAAEVLAERTTGRRQEFINMMNGKALFLGMKDTHFINPSGLQENEQDQYSSAYDVALMARFAIKEFPWLLDITRQTEIDLPQTDTHQDYTLHSGINLVTTYPGVMGFKTGFTPEAGLTLVTVAQREGHVVLGVILGSEDRRAEARELLDYSFQKLGVKI
jgi:D-alanyl-D-alanine carboxypeptidase (penicillin-binding protein 5/6)